MPRGLRFATFRAMGDRHYLCEQCGLKWFVPASRADEPGELHCGECGTTLTPRAEPAGQARAPKPALFDALGAHG